MVVISTREFRTKQGQYLGMIVNGEDVVLKSREKGSFRIVPIQKDDTLMSKEQFFAKIDRALEQAKQGKTRTLSKEEQAAFLGLE